VETLKAERDTIESEFKCATNDIKATFLSALAKDGAIDEPNISVENLGKCYGPLQKQVRESVTRQDKLIAEIEVCLRFSREIVFFFYINRRLRNKISIKIYNDFRLYMQNLRTNKLAVVAHEKQHFASSPLLMMHLKN
jgi:hypothetical protein